MYLIFLTKKLICTTTMPKITQSQAECTDEEEEMDQEDDGTSLDALMFKLRPRIILQSLLQQVAQKMNTLMLLDLVPLEGDIKPINMVINHLLVMDMKLETELNKNQRQIIKDASD